MGLANYNRRHKAVLFLTLIVAGLALLNGVAIRQSLGIVLLGVGTAWAIGSSGLITIWAKVRKPFIDFLDLVSQILYVSLVIVGLILIWAGLTADVSERSQAIYAGVMFLAIAFLVYRKYGKPQSWRRSKKK